MTSSAFALAALADIEAALGPRAVRRGESLRQLDPGWHPQNLAAEAMAVPASTAEVAEVVRICANLGVPLVPQGGRTGLVEGAISKPGQIVISLERLDQIERIDPIERVAVVGGWRHLAAPAGSRSARSVSSPAVDIAARGSATLGGMASTNAGGIMAFRNGVMRHQTFGLEAVLPNGEIFSDMTRVVKVATGYDLKHLLIGAEGTLGIITRLVLKLEPKPMVVVSALLALPSFGAALAAIDLGLREGNMRAAEAISRPFLMLNAAAQGFRDPALDESQPLFLLMSFGGREQGELREQIERLYVELTAGFPDVSGVIADSERQSREISRLREDTHTVYRAFPAAPSYDVSVPISEIEAYVERIEAGAADLGLRPFIFGHLADGNLHIIFSHAGPFPERLGLQVESLLYDRLAELGGAFSAEHGVGAKRVHSLYATAHPGKLHLMTTIKKALDPNGLINPGKVIRAR